MGLISYLTFLFLLSSKGLCQPPGAGPQWNGGGGRPPPLPWPSNPNGYSNSKDVVDRILRQAPILDAHNDLPFNIRYFAQGDLRRAPDYEKNITGHEWYHSNGSEVFVRTDIPKLREGGVGGVFFTIYTECDTQMKDAVIQSFEQIDLIKRFYHKYQKDFMYATSSQDFDRALKAGKIAGFMGVEGGHSIQSNYGLLRSMYALGARYMTLTHNCNTPWADSHMVEDPPGMSGSFLTDQFKQFGDRGLSDWGLGLIDEMNRLGMMIDLSHTSSDVMRTAIRRSKAPVIYSHSLSRAVTNHSRNVPDDVLRMLKDHGGIVCMNLYSVFAQIGGSATLAEIVAHANHIREVASIDNIGIGSDFDGVEETIVEIQHPGHLRRVLEALYDTGKWTEQDLAKVASGNLVRVMQRVEQVRDQLRNQKLKQDAHPVPKWMNSPDTSITQVFF